MNGSINSGGTRSVRVRPPTELEPQDGLTPLGVAAPPKAALQNPIIILGNMRREPGAIATTLVELPRSDANYDGRLRSVIASCSSIARQARELLEDEARRQEASR